MYTARDMEIQDAQNKNTVFLALVDGEQLRDLLAVIPAKRLKIINKYVYKGICGYEVRLRGANYAK